jgi:hypothetical protein
MKIPWGSPTVIKMRLVIVAVIIFVLAVFLWPQHTIYSFSVEPGKEYTVSFQGKDFEYNLFVHSIDASAGTAELSVFIPARSVYPSTASDSAAYSTFALSLEQNWAVTLKDFKVGETYRFEEGDNNVTLFKMTKVDDTQAVFSILDSWSSDNPETQGVEFTTKPIVLNESLSVATDKAKYAQGETVNISITNDTDSDIEMCDTMYRIGPLNSSDDRIEWRQLMLGNTGYSENDSFMLHAGESISASWNQTEQVWSSDWSVTEAIQVAPGRYKIEAIPFTGNPSSASMGYIDSCYSRPAEFPLDKLDYSVIIEIE